MNEPYFCLNCGFFGSLNTHLRCSACNSDSVTNAHKTDIARLSNEPLADWAIRIVDRYIAPSTAVGPKKEN